MERVCNSLALGLSRHSKAMNQRCSESNRLPKDEDTKLKKRETFRKKRRRYITSRDRVPHSVIG
jgi:hypothetical protein